MRGTNGIMKDNHAFKLRLSEVGRSVLTREEHQELFEEIYQKIPFSQMKIKYIDYNYDL